MIEENAPSKTVCYSPYGYVEVDESDLKDKTVIPFTSCKSKITGTINVNILNIYS